MIRVGTRDDALLLPVRVQPGASRADIGGEHDGRLKVRVTAPPERGKANKALVRELSRLLGVPASDIAVVGGQTHRDKLVAVRGIAYAELARQLAGRASVQTQPSGENKGESQ